MAGAVQIISRAMSEPAYRELLLTDFDRATEGFELDDAERVALKGITRQSFERSAAGQIARAHAPIRASRRVILAPAPALIDAAPGDVVIRVAARSTPHESTRASLAALEDHLRPGDRVLDLDAGTGILSIAAVGLGAGRALALDLDPGAVRVIRANVRLNSLTDTVRAEVGALPDALANRFELPDPAFDLVVANVPPHALLDLIRDGVARALRPGGRLIMAGMRHEHLRLIARVLPSAGLEEVGRCAEGQWPALVLRRKEPHARESLRPGWRSGMPAGGSQVS